MHSLMPANNFFSDSLGMVTENGTSTRPGVDDAAALTLALEMMANTASSPVDHIFSPSMLNGVMIDDNMLSDAERASKRSQNMTECVGVPSSEHVAEIVGRQGCKIKALRAKTNTYIKTPVRGEEPVFVVTGRKEDVANAKKEILSAADHFSQIRACRKSNLNGSMAPGPPNMPGQITISVRVPYRVVGLVVGPKGATIKRIQQQTQTYIVTPSRDKEPVFEVSGLPDSVDAARKEIEAHIAMRTGQSSLEEETLTAFAAAHGFTVDQVISNPEILNLYKIHINSNYMSNSSTTPNSLNAMLSTSNFSNPNVAMNQYNNLMNGHLSNSSANGISNGLSSFSSLGSGLANNYSSSNGGGGVTGMNSIANSLASFSNSQQSLSSQLSSIGSNMELFGNLQSFSSMNPQNEGYNSVATNGLANGSSFGASSGLNGKSSALPGLNCDIPSNFSLLGDTATSLMNSINKATRSGSSLDLGNSLFSSIPLARGNFDLPTSSTFQSVYGVDEGLGSLGSSIGSSPPLDHAQPAPIWSSDSNKFPVLANLLGSKGLGSMSDTNTPSQRQSPIEAGFHSPARRSSSDPTQQSLMTALSGLQLRDTVNHSQSTALDFGAAAFIPQTVGNSFSNTNGTSGRFLPTFSSNSAISQSCSSEHSTEVASPPSPSNGQSSDSSKGSDKVCTSCHANRVVAAFVPCGHNITCMECAIKIKEEKSGCPCCNESISEAIEIRSS